MLIGTAARAEGFSTGCSGSSGMAWLERAA
jgi:hypothetical protein